MRERPRRAVKARGGVGGVGPEERRHAVAQQAIDRRGHPPSTHGHVSADVIGVVRRGCSRAREGHGPSASAPAVGPTTQQTPWGAPRTVMCKWGPGGRRGPCHAPAPSPPICPYIFASSWQEKNSLSRLSHKDFIFGFAAFGRLFFHLCLRRFSGCSRFRWRPRLGPRPYLLLLSRPSAGGVFWALAPLTPFSAFCWRPSLCRATPTLRNVTQFAGPLRLDFHSISQRHSISSYHLWNLCAGCTPSSAGSKSVFLRPRKTRCCAAPCVRPLLQLYWKTITARC